MINVRTEWSGLTPCLENARVDPVKILAAIFCLLQVGCLLQPEDCGEGFKPVEDRCVPLKEAPPLNPDAQAFEFDAATLTDVGKEGLIDGDLADGSPFQDAETIPDMASPWAEYTVILIVDRTEDGDARETPAVPGADIDGLLLKGGVGEIIGFAGQVIDSRINDPFRANIQREPRAALLTPDDRAVSLGSQGGYVRLGLELQRSLRAGDSVEVYELIERPGDPDRYETFLCRGNSEGLRGCRILGIGEAGRMVYVIPSE